MAVTPGVIKRGKRTLPTHQLQPRQQQQGSGGFSGSAVTIAVSIVI